jgi:lysophospholipase L1-like esterase
MRLTPLPFFVGLVLGLLALSWLGSIVESPRLTQSFVRFHQLINVEFGYFPTARQIRAVVERRIKPEPKVYVIIGGNSVEHGVGQHESLIWTRFLQEHLGSSFRVINLAQRAGSSVDFGNIGAELLLRQGRSVIYVGGATLTNFAADLRGSFYRHAVFDAWYRGYLLPWPPRDRLLSEAAWRGPSALRGHALGALLNAYLNFNDLWNFVSYEYANSNWNPLLITRSFEPRASFADPDLMPEQYASLRYRDDMGHAMRLVRGQILSPTDQRWQRIMALNEQMTPPRLRGVTLAIIHLNSPYYLDRLDPADREAFVAQAYDHARRLREIGFHRAEVPGTDFTADDYVDRVHSSVSGGQKLAARIAPIIRTMATDLGYLP